MESLASSSPIGGATVSSGPHLPAAGAFIDVSHVHDLSESDLVSSRYDSTSSLPETLSASPTESLPVVDLTPRVFSPLFITDHFSRHLIRLCFTRTRFIDHSVIAQLDGLIHAVFRVRLEHDICAKDEKSSYCKSFGRSYSPMSAFVALIFPSNNDLARL